MIYITLVLIIPISPCPGDMCHYDIFHHQAHHTWWLYVDLLCWMCVPTVQVAYHQMLLCGPSLCRRTRCRDRKTVTVTEKIIPLLGNSKACVAWKRVSQHALYVSDTLGIVGLNTSTWVATFWLVSWQSTIKVVLCLLAGDVHMINKMSLILVYVFTNMYH